MTILGTRPEIIRLSRVIALLNKYVDHIIVHTGQNYDYNLNEVFFKDLEIPRPDYFLEVNTESFGTVYGETIIKTESLIRKERPDAVLILGDTNSSIAALVAKRMKIPIYHLEAGNRSFDPNVPEEINRKLIDHLADFNFVYSEHARRNLLAEGISPRRIYLSGSPMLEILDYFKKSIDNSQILNSLNLQAGNFFLVSSHREEIVDRKLNLTKFISILEMLSDKYQKDIVVSTHPRTRKRLSKFVESYDNLSIKFLEPFGYFDYITLQKNAFCTLSDSGTISEESAILGFPAITFRNSMERPEAMDTGSIILSGLDETSILKSIEILQNKNIFSNTMPEEYSIGDFSHRVIKIIIGTVKLSNTWAGIKLNDI